jgi:hypothetical protein
MASISLLVFEASCFKSRIENGFPDVLRWFRQLVTQILAQSKSKFGDLLETFF